MYLAIYCDKLYQVPCLCYAELQTAQRFRVCNVVYFAVFNKKLEVVREKHSMVRQGDFDHFFL